MSDVIDSASMAPSGVFTLPEELTFDSVAEVKSAVDTHITGQQRLIMDGSAMKHLDGAGTQFLLACLQQTRNELSEPALILSNPLIEDAFASIGASNLLLAGIDQAAS